MQRRGARGLVGALWLSTACGGQARDTERESSPPLPSEPALLVPVATPPVATPSPSPPVATPPAAMPDAVDEVPPPVEVVAPLPPSDPPDDDNAIVDSSPADPNLRVEACNVVGGYDRRVVKQRDLAQGLCVEVVLVSPAWLGVPAGLTMPEGWGYESGWLYDCTSTGKLVMDGLVRELSDAQGSVSFGLGVPSMGLDLSLLGFGSEGVPTRLVVPYVAVTRECVTYGPQP